MTLLNIHRPRDRSHYERFAAYHQSFYRSVEATSVTPFSPRALDRGLAGTLVALARQGHAPMTPPKGATEILAERRSSTSWSRPWRSAPDACGPDARGGRGPAPAGPGPGQGPARRVEPIAMDLRNIGGELQYQTEVGAAQRLLYEFLDPN